MLWHYPIMKLHPEVAELLQAMRELEFFLTKHNELFWSGKVKQTADWVEQSDGYGVTRFLGLFGGMGSLNDVILQRDGQMLNVETEQLTAMCSRAYSLADRLRHEAS